MAIFVPRANPDFDDRIGLVGCWLLEFDDEESPPVREIGLSEEGELLVKMPWGENCGYWTDNNMRLWDFRRQFNVGIISRADFERHWEMDLV